MDIVVEEGSPVAQQVLVPYPSTLLPRLLPCCCTVLPCPAGPMKYSNANTVLLPGRTAMQY
eukprot:2522934-Rhodomonas_salina.2